MPRKWLVPPDETVHEVTPVRLCVADESLRPTVGHLWVTDRRVAWVIGNRGVLTTLLRGDGRYVATETLWSDLRSISSWHLDGRSRLLIIEVAGRPPQRFLQSSSDYPALTLALRRVGLTKIDNRDCSWVFRPG